MKNIVFIAFLCTGFSFGQTDSFSIVGGANLTNSSLGVTSGTWITNIETKTTKGSVYLYNNWQTAGIITTKDDKHLSIKGLNYDTQMDVFVAKVSNDSVYMFANGNIKDVILNNKKFKMYGYNNELHYYEVLAFGQDIEILKRNTKEIKNGVLNPLTQITTPDRYIDNSIFYFKKGNSIKEIKLKKKSFSKLFGDHSKDIKQFISDNNISLKDERKLQTILNYNNTL